MDHNGICYLPTAQKQRQLLALLLLNANRFVPTEKCIKELWDDAPPRTVIPTLHTYALQLRRRLAESPSVGSLAAAHETLVTCKGGYRLVVGDDSLDLIEFERLTRAARDAACHHDRVKIADILRQALMLRRGRALSDIEPGPCLRPQIERLEEEQISLMEQLYDAELGLGRHRTILGELNAAAAEYPFNEHIQEQYMLALYRSGRQARALATFQQLRKTLNEELGLEPAQSVRQLHEAIITADPGLELEAC